MKYFYNKRAKTLSCSFRPAGHIVPNFYKELTEEQYKTAAELMRNLNRSDLSQKKFIDGEITAEEYEPIKEQRRVWREQLRAIID